MKGKLNSNMQTIQHKVLQEHENDHWWFRVRRELVHDIIAQYAKTSEHLAIADIGCGEGGLAKEMERYGSVVGVDPSEEALAFSRARGIKELVQGSADKTNLPSATYDIVTCLDVLEHLSDETPAIAEIERILKPGGIAIIFVPTFMFLWGANDDASLHYRRYRLPAIVKKFTDAHFEILKHSYFNTFLFPPIALVRIVVRALGLKTKPDFDMGNSVSNSLFYHIFTLERPLLRSIDLPFGVSAMVIARKPV